MNFHGSESNPIMSRPKSQKSIILGINNNSISEATKKDKPNDTIYISPTTPTFNNDEEKKENITSKIYKPPIRSQSSRPNKNVSTNNTYNTTNTTNTSTASNSTTVNNLSGKGGYINGSTNKPMCYSEEIEEDFNNLTSMNNNNLNNLKNMTLNINNSSNEISNSSNPTNMKFQPRKSNESNIINTFNSNNSINSQRSSNNKNIPNQKSLSSNSNSNSNFMVQNKSQYSYNTENNFIDNTGNTRNSIKYSNNLFYNNTNNSHLINNNSNLNNSNKPISGSNFNNFNNFNNNNNNNSSSLTVNSFTGAYKLPSHNLSTSNLINNQNNYSENDNYSTSTYKSQDQNRNRNQNQEQYIINIEDLMLLEEKLDEIIYNLNMNRPMINECFEWWNFYFNCSLCGKLEFYFKDESNKNVIRDYTHLELLSIIICYDSSYDKKLFDSIIDILKSILILIHQNFLTICDYIISKVSSESQSNIWVTKLKSLVDYKMSNYKLGYKNNSTYMSYMSEIKSNNSGVYDYLRIILKNYPSQNNEVTDTLISYFKNINKLNVQILNDFFRGKILRVVNKNASVLASTLINSKEDLKLMAVPYLKKESIKFFTLVLDLDETLIHFKIDNVDENKGLLRLRPGIFEFLDSVVKHYELIVFTAGTQDYADPILDAIEQDRIYFDYRLYRQHAVIVNNDFVKDISKLGRELSKIIIIDNMPQNFRLQKENGIFIKTFYGEDADDTALLDLIPILNKIAEDKVKDVRTSLMKFKDEILKRISSNIEKGGHLGKYK